MIRKRTSLPAIGLAVLVGCQVSDTPDAPPPPNVLLITIDTLRADRLGSYGYRLPTSPNIDELARRGARFSDCTVQWPKTRPSMASLITGAYPKTTGIKYGRRTMHESFLFISEVFRRADYRTGAVVANFNIGKTFGFDQGFDAFVESWREGWARQTRRSKFTNAPGKVKRFTDARIVTDQGLGWLAEGDPRPFFLWLHYMDPHGPYVPPAEYDGYFTDAHPPEPIALEKLPRYQVQHEPEGRRPIADLGFYRAQYDREIRFLDDELGRLFDELASLGVDSANTVIVLTADHGESFDEHEYYLEHGKFSYQACAHVPLIVSFEPEVKPGQVVERPVGLIDASATILDLVGIEIPRTFEGQSLVPLIAERDGGSGPEYVFMEAGQSEQTQLTVRKGNWKLIRVASAEDRRQMTGGEYELYDIRADPAELSNLAEVRPDVVRELAEAIDEWQVAGPRWRKPGDPITLEALHPDELEMLRSLGYVE